MQAYYNRSFRLKTQHAIEVINKYQNIHQKSNVNLILKKSDDQIKRYKDINQNQWVKMQFIPNNTEGYALQSNSFSKNMKAILKIVIKSFKGPAILFGVSKKVQQLSIGSCQYSVDGQKIFKIHQYCGPGQKTYITFHSKDLTLFKFKYEFLINDEEHFQNKVRAQSLQTLKLINKYSNLTNTKFYSKIKSPKIQEMLDLKIKLKSPKNIKKQGLVSARLKSIQNQKTKSIQNKQKRQNIVIFREKCIALEAIYQKCKGLVQEYQQVYFKKRQYEEINSRTITLTITMINFLAAFNRQAKIHCQRVQYAKKHRFFLMKLTVRIKKYSRRVLQIEPNHKKRLANTINQFIRCETKCVQKMAELRAGQILIQCLIGVQLAVRINTVLDLSSEFRIKARKIQKYWRTRNVNQIYMFKQYVNYQVLEIIKKQPHFKPLREQFFNMKIKQKLSWDYLKEITSKTKTVIKNYTFKLRQIQQIKEANEKIVEFNKTCLKKYTKNLLIEPIPPSFPVTRYFRDIAFLKSMIRSWFQLQNRKIIKKNQKSPNQTLKK